VLLHQLVHGIDRAGEEHGLRPHLEDLHQVRRVLLAIGGDGGGERLGVAALAERLHLVLALARVELFRLGFERLCELPGERVPEVDLRLLRVRRRGGEDEREGDGESGSASNEARHGSPPAERTGVVRGAI